MTPFSDCRKVDGKVPFWVPFANPLLDLGVVGCQSGRFVMMIEFVACILNLWDKIRVYRQFQERDSDFLVLSWLCLIGCADWMWSKFFWLRIKGPLSDSHTKKRFLSGGPSFYQPNLHLHLITSISSNIIFKPITLLLLFWHNDWACS